jgi:1-acyl-sn-glycerol-3-phosphate acyltransferase
VIRRSARAATRLAGAVGLSSLLYGAVRAHDGLGRLDDDRRDRYVRRWARGLLRLFDVELVLEPESFAPLPARTPRPRMVVANHRSTLDVLLLLHLFGGHLLARGDMSKWPYMGELARTAGTVFVDRKDPISGAAAVQRIGELLAKQRSIAVFPEGTTFAGDEVRPFHAGAFVAARRVRGEILPVGIAYEDPGAHYLDESIGAHGRRLIEARRTRVAVAIGAPIDASRAKIDALRDQAHAEVQRLVERARARLSR